MSNPRHCMSALVRVTIGALLGALVSAGPSAAVTPAPIECKGQSLFLHESVLPTFGAFFTLNDSAPSAGDIDFVDSPPLKLLGGNPWREIGSGWLAVVTDPSC